MTYQDESIISACSIIPCMKLSPSLSHLAADAIASQIGDAARCEAANFRWESAVSDKRADEYAVDIGNVATHRDWKAEHKSYLTSAIHVAKDLPRSAECFLDINRQAWLNEAIDDTCLLRLESLGPVFDQPLLVDLANDFWQRFYKSQKDLRKPKLSDNDEALRAQFVTQWNEHRTQARPMFATLLNDFEGGNLKKLVKTDWPHTLRNRLGLTHYPSTTGKPLPVALMCFSVDEVRQARALATRKGAAASFARPTVLDAEISAAFVPAPLLPGGANYGHTLDLANTGIPTTFTPELLAFPIDYQARHIKALGFITRAHALQQDADMLSARNRHVQGLQALPNCADFGEVLP